MPTDFNVSAASLEDDAYLTALRRSHEDLFVVSCSATSPPRFVLVDELRFWVMAFNHGLQPPTGITARIDSHLHVYRLARRR